MRVRLKDIAQKLGVSESTVSRALSNHPRISKKTKKKVLNIAKRLNYQPDLIAQSLKLKKTKTIGLIIDDITNPFYPEIVKGSEEIANKNELNIILCNSDYDPIKERKYLNVLLSKRVDGVLMMPVGKKLSIIELLKDLKTPLVFIDIKPTERINVSCVYTDQEYGSYTATKHLIELGHSKIALVNGQKSLSSCQQLETGYLKAMKEFHLRINNNYLRVCDLKASGGYNAVKELIELNKEDKPTAAIFISDITAVAAYNVINEMGLEIPKDFSIIGNDDIPTSKNLSPPLTTIAHPKYKMGTRAMEILINEMENIKNDKKYKQIRFNPELIIRKSTTKPPIN